ncbi:MAG TPA: ABC transporter permease [Bryobacteraceae bacterium]|jgi:predicted permease
MYGETLSVWLDSLCADAVFGWRQLTKRKAISAAAILSLGLAIGACIAAFRIVDALFLRPLPIANADRLYGVSLGENARNLTYAEFRQMRATRGKAELIAVSGAPGLDVTYGSDQEIERIHGQFVSGWMFGSFGLRPALGRLLTESDDLKAGAHPVAVLSYDYWTHRFGRDPAVVGRTMRLGPDWRIGESSKAFEIVGVAPERFVGTETGVVIDLFLPTMMQALVEAPYAGIFRAFVLLPPDEKIEPVRDRLLAALRASSADESKAPRTLAVESAVAGASNLRRDYRQSLAALVVLVGLVLFIACANAANLMTAQAAARSREMALRVSLGARRGHLIQLVLVESAILALFASAAGGLFAIWSGPFVVARINPPDDPASLPLTVDWRVIVFSLALTLGITFLFGLAPALRTSRIQPFGALKSGGSRRIMHSLVAAQVAFCFLGLFVAGLFVTTFDHLSNQPTGISAARVLNLSVTTLHTTEPPILWQQIGEHLRRVPGVESVAFADWPVLDGNGYKTTGISVDGAVPTDITAWLENISPGWIDTLRIPLLAGRDFSPADAPGMVIVNEEFARAFFNGRNPVGRTFEATWATLRGKRLEIVGLVGDARYRYLRQATLPVAYTNFYDGKGMMANGGTVVVRTATGNPSAVAPLLRQEVSRANTEFRVSAVHTQQEFIDAQTIRERLLATLAGFFAVVALLLAGIGLYGVLDYSIFQRRREIGIRMAIGAQAGDIARQIIFEIVAWILAGALTGLALGMASVRYIESLLYQIKTTDPSTFAVPSLALLAMALLAAAPPLIRAVRIDPVNVLRSE